MSRAAVTSYSAKFRYVGKYANCIIGYVTGMKQKTGIFRQVWTAVSYLFENTYFLFHTSSIAGNADCILIDQPKVVTILTSQLSGSVNDLPTSIYSYLEFQIIILWINLYSFIVKNSSYRYCEWLHFFLLSDTNYIWQHRREFSYLIQN